MTKVTPLRLGWLLVTTSEGESYIKASRVTLVRETSSGCAVSIDSAPALLLDLPAFSFMLALEYVSTRPKRLHERGFATVREAVHHANEKDLTP